MTRIDEVRSGDATKWEYALDVLGHAGLGTAYALPFISMALFVFNWGILASIAFGIGIALFGGVVREVVQYSKSGKLHFEDRFWDAMHHILGGPIAFGIIMLVRLAF